MTLTCLGFAGGCWCRRSCSACRARRRLLGRARWHWCWCRGQVEGAGRQRLAPLQKLLVLVLAETRGHLSGRVARAGRWLLLLLLLGTEGGTLAIATAAGRGQGEGQAGAGRGHTGAGLGRVWHCGANREGEGHTEERGTSG